MNAQELLWSHKYAEAVADLRRLLEFNPDDMAVVEGMAKALRANGEYQEALSFFERLAAGRRRDKIANAMAPGNPAWHIDIACLHWLSGDRSKATREMHELVAGILSGSIKYGDAAGGMSQGLLLYYMAVTENNSKEAAFALDYLRNRVKRTFSKVWPFPIAQYYLGDIGFEAVMEAVSRQPAMAVPLDPAKIDLGRRRRCSVALFHHGVRHRTQGDKEYCLARMRECYSLENPLIEQEWYLARYEVQNADNQRASRGS